jgi:hypothetical protein
MGFQKAKDNKCRNNISGGYLMSVHLQVYDVQGAHIGHFDGEFFYTTPKSQLRVDGKEVYSLTNGSFLGMVDDSNIVDLSGKVIYQLRA